MRALGVPAIAVIVTALFAGGVVISHEAARTGEASAASVAPSPYELVSMDAPYGKGTATLRWRPVDGVSGYDIKIDEKTVSSAGVGQTFATFAVKGGHHKFAAWTKYPAPPPPTTTAPTTSTGGTTTTPPVTTTPTTTSTPTTTAGPPPAGQVTLRTTGNDATCTRNGTACVTFNRAFAVAQPGDTITVHGGAYPADAAGSDRNQLDGAKTSPVTFVCAGDGNVTFQAPNFIVWAGTAGATFQGDCFHFHVVTAGLGGYPQLTHDIRFDGVHMDAFEIIGAKNVQIVNSEIGPFVACGAADAPAYAKCPAGSYWAQFPNGSDAAQQEPFIHNGAAGKATNITLDHDRIHGLTSLWSGTHTGGLLIWNTDNLRVTNTTFDGNAIYDIEQNSDSVDNGLVLQNNTFGYPVFTADSGNPSANNGHREVECCGSGDHQNGWLIDHNTFTNGIRIDAAGTWTNSTASNNNFGAAADCGPFPGLTFTGNTRCG